MGKDMQTRNDRTYSRGKGGHQRYHPYASASYPYQPYWNPAADQQVPDCQETLFDQSGENSNVDSSASFPPARSPRHYNRGGNHVQRRGGGAFRNRGAFHGPPGEHKAWMTEEILEAIKERNELQKKAEITQNPDDWCVFKAVRNRTNLLVNDAKRIYEMANNVRPPPKSEDFTVGESPKSRSSFYCDTCDKSFADQNLLKEHTDEHVVCQLDGCSFTAHPKIIMKHIEMQHSNNLFLRVKGYETPEDIAKWKAERRAKYPTEVNMIKKKEEDEEKFQRGERMPMQNGRDRRRGRNILPPEAKPHSNKQESKEVNQGSRRRHSYPETKTTVQPKEGIVDDPPTKAGRRLPRPAFTFGDDNRPSVSSQRCASKVIVLESFYAQIKKMEKGTLGGKKLLMWNSKTQSLCQKIARTGRPMSSVNGEGDQESDYESENEDADFITDEDDNVTVPAEDVKSNTTAILPVLTQCQSIDHPDPAGLKTEEKPLLKSLVAYSSDSEDEAPDEIPTVSSAVPEEGEIVEDEIEVKPAVVLAKPTQTQVKHDGVSSIPAAKVVQKVDKPARNSVIYKKRRPRVPRLLQKLLENDIRHERNEILQVCRFIVENNFFDDNTVSSKITVHPGQANLDESGSKMNICHKATADTCEQNPKPKEYRCKYFLNF